MKKILHQYLECYYLDEKRIQVSKDSFIGTERSIFKPYCWHEVTKLKLGITLCELKFFISSKK